VRRGRWYRICRSTPVVFLARFAFAAFVLACFAVFLCVFGCHFAMVFSLLAMVFSARFVVHWLFIPRLASSGGGGLVIAGARPERRILWKVERKSQGVVRGENCCGAAWLCGACAPGFGEFCAAQHRARHILTKGSFH
jgi:hypothetical protein